MIGSQACSECPEHTESSVASISKDACICKIGFEGPNGGPCVEIPWKPPPRPPAEFISLKIELMGFDSADEFERFGDDFISGVASGIGHDYSSDDVFFLELCEGVDCKEFPLRREGVPGTALQLTFGVRVQNNTNIEQLSALLQSSSFLAFLEADLSQKAGKSISAGFIRLPSATDDNIVANASTTSVGTPAPSTSGLQQTPIAVASSPNSLGNLTQELPQNTYAEDTSGVQMGTREIFLLSGGLTFFILCLVGTSIIVNRRFRPRTDNVAPDKQRILAFMMARHERLGDQSPAGHLDNRVMWHILQCAGLISHLPENSESKDLINKAVPDELANKTISDDELTYVDGMMNDVITDFTSSDEGSDNYVDIPFMDREGVKRRRDYLLELMKDDRTKRRKRGEPESSSDEEKDLLKVTEQIEGMATYLRKNGQNSIRCVGQKALQKVSLDADRVEQCRKHMQKMIHEQRRFRKLRGEPVSSSDEERDMRRVDAELIGFARRIGPPSNSRKR